MCTTVATITPLPAPFPYGLIFARHLWALGKDRVGREYHTLLAASETTPVQLAHILVDINTTVLNGPLAAQERASVF